MTRLPNRANRRASRLRRVVTRPRVAKAVPEARTTTTTGATSGVPKVGKANNGVVSPGGNLVTTRKAEVRAKEWAEESPTYSEHPGTEGATAALPYLATGKQVTQPSTGSWHQGRGIVERS